LVVPGNTEFDKCFPFGYRLCIAITIIIRKLLEIQAGGCCHRGFIAMSYALTLIISFTYRSNNSIKFGKYLTICSVTRIPLKLPSLTYNCDSFNYTVTTFLTNIPRVKTVKTVLTVLTLLKLQLNYFKTYSY